MEKVGRTKKIALEILKKGYPVLFIGDRGIGKTSIAMDIAKEIGKEVFYLNVSQMFPENISFPKESNNLLEFITFDFEDKVVILDELTNRNPDMHSLLQSFVLDKRIGTRQFRNVYFVATGNRPEQSAIATYLPRPLIERFVVIDFPVPTKEEWATYTIKKGGNQVFVNFILQATQNYYYRESEEIGLEQSPSPRNNTRTAILLSEIIDGTYMGNEDKLAALREELDIIVSGSSGKDVFGAFYNYLLSGRYYSYKNFEKKDYPQNDNEVLSLITDIAELFRQGQFDFKRYEEVFSYIYAKFPRYAHYLLSYTALHNGNVFRANLYDFASKNRDSTIAKYLEKTAKSSRQ